MSERLKEIWSGFQETTSRRLTGGVDKINVPSRIDWQAEDKAFLPEGFDSPAVSAFAQLNDDLKQKAKLFARKDKKKAKEEDAVDVTEAAPLEASFAGEHELLKGLRATAIRTERTEIDYGAFLDDGGANALESLKKKKRFGIF
ncbi:MAG: hypothetical protein AAGA09_07235 [Pseudomonadota bacterium]